MLKSLFYFAFVCGVISSVHSQNSSMDKNEVDPKVGVEPKNSVESTKIVQKIIADDESKDGVDPKVGVEPKNSVESTKIVQKIIAGNESKDGVNPKVGVEPKNSVESTKIVQKIIAGDESKDGVDPKVGVEPKNSVESTKNVQEIKAGNCISCNETTSDCLKPLTNGSSVKCEHGNQNRCYTKLYENGFIQRGCFEKLNATDLCKKGSSKTCNICSDDNCNHKVFPANRLSCHICNTSSKNCSSDFKNHTAMLCPKYDQNDKCYISNYKGNYERGCLSGGSNRCKSEKCMICDEDGCNSGFFSSANGQYSVATMISFMFFSFTMVLVNT